MTHPVIVATARTPIGRAFKGSLVDERPDDLMAFAITSLLMKVPSFDPTLVEDIIIGNGEPAGEAGFNIARVSGILAGLPHSPGVTVNRYCASSLQAIRMASNAVAAQDGEIFIAGGVETTSRFGHGMADSFDVVNPRFRNAMDRSLRNSQSPNTQWVPSEGLPDVYIQMGQTAENVAAIEGVTRNEMDEFAARSQELAVAHQLNGFFDNEISRFTNAAGIEVSQDDGPRPESTLEKLASLPPVFRDNGLITAGNACPLNDGAAAVLVMSEQRARSLGLKPLAKILSSGTSALNPEIMGLGPIEASRRALTRAGKTMREVDLVEINEAFAAQVIPCAKQLDIPLEKLNIRGGAIALGHPFGMTGARLITTLINSLQQADKRLGLATLCVGGGQGMAMLIELAA